MAKINRKELLSKLKGDVTSCETTKALWDNKRSTWVKEYNGEPYGNETKGKASVVSRDVKKAAAGQHAAIIDPFVTNEDIVICDPVTAEDRPAAEQAQVLLNFQFCRDFNRYQFISNSFKVLQREGTVVAKVGWERVEEEREVEKPVFEVIPMESEEMMQQYAQALPDQAEMMQQQLQAGQKPFAKIQTGTEMVMENVVVHNRPTLELCRNSMLWIDPTVEGDISEAQFVAYKFKSNMSELRKDSRYKNLDKIKQKEARRDFNEDPYTKTTDTSFSFTDEPREELEVVEYWGNYDLNEDGIAEPIICTYVNDIIIRLEDNPYPDKQIPFVSCAFDNEPFSMNGEANAELIGTDQKIKTGIKRAILDTLDSSTSGQKGNKKGALDPVNLKKFREGKYFEYNGQSPEVWEGKFQSIPADILNFYGMVDSEITQLTGVRAASGGPSSSLGLSATAARGALDATAKREIDISRNYKESFLIPILRKWLAMDQEFMDEEQVVRVTAAEFVPVRRDDLDGNVDISMEVSTPEADNEKSTELAFLLQTTAQSLPFDLTKILLAKQAKLKKMPDLASQIMEYQPQPDPMEQQMKQLEMQKLQAEIAERQSRAQENEVDMRLKTANAVLAEAQARKVHSEADIKDQDFLDKTSGVSHQRDMEKQDRKIQGDLVKQSMASQAKAYTGGNQTPQY